MKAGQFAKITTNKYKKHGLTKGTVVYLAGQTAVPLKENNPYVLSVLFVAAWVKDDDMDLERPGFLVKPKEIDPLSDEENERLQQIREARFKEAQEADGRTEAE